jgi:hypothetical protein
MDYFNMWSEIYAVSNQGALMIADVLVTNLFCHFGVPREMHSDQGQNFKPWILQGVLWHLRVYMKCATPLHPQLDGTTSEQWKSTSERLFQCTTQTAMTGYHISCLLTEYPSTRTQAQCQPARVWEGAVPCMLLSGAPSDKEQPTTNYVVNSVEWLHDIHHYEHQYLMAANQWQEESSIWMSNQQHIWIIGWRPGLLVLPYSDHWYVICSHITWMNDVVYRIQLHPWEKTVVCLNRLGLYL